MVPQSHGHKFIGPKHPGAGIGQDDWHKIENCIRGSQQDYVGMVPCNINALIGCQHPGYGQESFQKAGCSNGRYHRSKHGGNRLNHSVSQMISRCVFLSVLTVPMINLFSFFTRFSFCAGHFLQQVIYPAHLCPHDNLELAAAFHNRYHTFYPLYLAAVCLSWIP